MSPFLLCLAIAFPRVIQGPAPTFTEVFSPNDGGYQSIRIPSLVVTKNHTLLAFAEGRAGTASDQASNKIILKRSADQGLSWQPLRVIEDDGANSLNNPCAVVDQSNGRVYLMYQRIPAGYTETSAKLEDGFEGPNVYRSLLTWTDDDGNTWHTPLDLTRFVKRASGVKTVCSGPGIGIQLTRGIHAGRLIFPFNEGPFYQWNNYAVFSDDHGQTWQLGDNAPNAIISGPDGKSRSQVNEVQMAELSDGSVRLNARQFAGAAVRKTAVSYDGGQSWSPVMDQLELTDPSCMGSLFRFSFGGPSGNGILLYSGPRSNKRDHGTVYESFDDGRTWPARRELFTGEFAYSVLTRLPNGQVGCLFETDNYRRISFARFPINWLPKAKKPIVLTAGNILWRANRSLHFKAPRPGLRPTFVIRTNLSAGVQHTTTTSALHPAKPSRAKKPTSPTVNRPIALVTKKTVPKRVVAPKPWAVTKPKPAPRKPKKPKG
jgi:sialidase-1